MKIPLSNVPFLAIYLLPFFETKWGQAEFFICYVVLILYKTKIFEVRYLSSVNKFIDIFIVIDESINCIECFDVSEIVKTLFNLNSRFEQLLHSSPLLIKTHFYLFHYQEMMNTFNELDIFSTKICSNLKTLSVTCSKNIIFLDAY